MSHPTIQIQGLSKRYRIGPRARYKALRVFTAMTRSIFYDVPPAGRVVCKIKYLPLIPGRYVVSIRLKDDQAGVADYVVDAARFEVLDSGGSTLSEFAPASYGSVLIPHEWEWLP